MENSIDIRCSTLDETKTLAEYFAKFVKDSGCFVCLYGDIGAGKTAFVRFAAQSLGVREKVTSPSFVILNEYYTSEIPIYHFDLYRLENVGISSVIDELREYSEGKKLTFVEWAEFSQNEIPFDRLEINVSYDDSDNRIYRFSSVGKKNINVIEALKEVYK